MVTDMAANEETVSIDTVKKTLWDSLEALGENISGETLSALMEIIEGGGGLPKFDSGDDGKVLTVDGDEVVWDDAPDGLPEINDGDDGKVLTVDGDDVKWGDLPADTVVVPFTVTVGEQGAVATTDASFSDVTAAIAAGKTVRSIVSLSGIDYCGELTAVSPSSNPTAVSFCIVADMSGPTETPAPALLRIVFSEIDCNATMVMLAVAT